MMILKSNSLCLVFLIVAFQASDCANIDEACTAGDCPTDATCDVASGNTCKCNTGFYGTSGSATCTAITCPKPTVTGGTNDCDDPSGFATQCTLICSSGYTLTAGNQLTCGDDDGDGNGEFDTIATCTNDDECTAGTHNCDANAACTDTGGSFTCACNNGYTGDGVTSGTGCTAIVCAAPSIANGTNSCAVSSSFGATCTLTCDAGFTANGTTLTCGDSNSDGTGDFNTLTCRTSGCALLSSTIFVMVVASVLQLIIK